MLMHSHPQVFFLDNVKNSSNGGWRGVSYIINNNWTSNVRNNNEILCKESLGKKLRGLFVLQIKNEDICSCFGVISLFDTLQCIAQGPRSHEDCLFNWLYHTYELTRNLHSLKRSSFQRLKESLKKLRKVSIQNMALIYCKPCMFGLAKCGPQRQSSLSLSINRHIF